MVSTSCQDLPDWLACRRSAIGLFHCWLSRIDDRDQEMLGHATSSERPFTADVSSLEDDAVVFLIGVRIYKP
jgi:hypothetical protein